MSISTSLYQFYREAKNNRWYRLFTVFTRIALAAGFIPSGMVKIMGERFTSLSVNHPMGHYLEALHHTEYYYTFIGVAQILAAILLLIPRTATLGALLYFPIILNICILSIAVRFDGSLFTSPMMVIANLYLILWDYDKIKYLFKSNKSMRETLQLESQKVSNKFPFAFAAGVLIFMIGSGFLLFSMFEIRPHNTQKDCVTQCPDSNNPEACEKFCDCIHQHGSDIGDCLDAYHQASRK